MITDAARFELEHTPWTARAACAGCDPELWFPDHGTGNSVARHAKAVCAGCPVRDECLTYALRWRIEHGIWGGLSHRERLRLQRNEPRPQLLAAPHGTTTRYARGCRCDTCRYANWQAAERRSSAR